MKIISTLLGTIFVLSAVSSLQAGEVILYGGLQKPGKVNFSSAVEVPADLLEGQWGGTYGLRLSGGRVIGYEESFSYSPRFARRGVNAFQMDTNLVLQAPTRITPYVTAGIGFIKTWGQDNPADLDPRKIASFAFSFGKQFSINYGGGIKIRRLMGPLGINMDVRGYTVPSVQGGSLNFVQTSLGAMFTW